MTDSQGSGSLFSSLRQYVRHLPGCQMIASHATHELVCTCGLDALMLETGSCAAVVDGAAAGGHHETVGERQGRQPVSNDPPPMCPYGICKVETYADVCEDCATSIPGAVPDKLDDGCPACGLPVHRYESERGISASQVVPETPWRHVYTCGMGHRWDESDLIERRPPNPIYIDPPYFP